MRVLFWQEPFWPQIGGMAVMAEHLLRALHDRGHEIAVVTRRDSPELPTRADWHGIPVHRFPFWRVLDDSQPTEVAALRREIAALERSFAPEVVHLSGFGPSALLHLQNAPARKTPVLLALHSSNTFSSAPTSLARQLLESADWVTACSAALLAEAQHSVPAIRPVSSVVHNGIAAAERPAVPAPATPRLLCVGSLEPHKGFDLAIRALPALHSRFADLVLRIAGAGSAGVDLQRLAEREGVSDRVEFLGAVPHHEVAHLLDESTAVLVPSRRESFPLIALEAATCARPVVAARVGGLAELVADGESGLLVAPEDAEALAAAISTLLADRARAAAMGAAAQALVRQRFALSAHVDAYEELYDRLRRSRRAVAGRSGAACG